MVTHIIKNMQHPTKTPTSLNADMNSCFHFVPASTSAFSNGSRDSAISAALNRAGYTIQEHGQYARYITKGN